MASIPRQASDSERQRGDGGPRNEVRSQQSARAESFDADESFESPLQSGRACEVTEQRVTRTAAETRLPEVASRFQPGMDEINHERSGTLLFSSHMIYSKLFALLIVLLFFISVI